MGASWGNSINNFIKSNQKITKISTAETNKIVDKTTDKLERDVKSFTPVDSGKLRDSWKTEKHKKNKMKENTLSNDLPYANAVEYGSKTNKPRRMLTKAIARSEKYVNRQLDNLGKKLKRDY